jgi:16S rRNA (cytidine1402-2'-O)-methyltransferase
VPRLLEALRDGSTVVLVSDAGTPLVSDPGYRLVAAAASAGLPVTVVPGPSAPLAALAVSGLPADRWCFEGFLPRKAGERRTRIGELAGERRTLVMLEAPRRLASTLAELAAAFGGDRRAVVCRELTKTHEEIRRGPLDELVGWARAGVLGEITLVIAGASSGPAAYTDDELAAAVAELVRTGLSRRDAIAAVASVRGISRRVVYAAATRL